MTDTLKPIEPPMTSEAKELVEQTSPYDELLNRLRTFINFWRKRGEFPGELRAFEDAKDTIERLIAEREKLVGALELALEYWAHRQQRYKNRHPAWVTEAREALSQLGSDA